MISLDQLFWIYLFAPFPSDMTAKALKYIQTYICIRLHSKRLAWTYIYCMHAYNIWCMNPLYVSIYSIYVCKYLFSIYCVCMYVSYMYVCLHVGMYMCICLYICIYVCICYVAMYVCVWACVCLTICVCDCMNVCMYLWLYVWLYVCMHACM